MTVLHTIGSPLDKFWYIDHSHARRHSDQKGLENRISHVWINYWAYSDPVSGRLNHYDAPGLRVINKRLRWLGLPLLSHVRYWNESEVIDEMRNEIRKTHFVLAMILP